MLTGNRISQNAVVYNEKIRDICSTASAAVAGATAGICGFEGLNGFLFFLVTSTLMSVIIKQNILKGFQSVFSFLLLWTMFYSIRIYE